MSQVAAPQTCSGQTSVPPDLDQITDEELLKQLWQQADDFSDRRRIRARMYKLREEHLREMVQNDEEAMGTLQTADDDEFSNNKSETQMTVTQTDGRRTSNIQVSLNIQGDTAVTDSVSMQNVRLGSVTMRGVDASDRSEKSYGVLSDEDIIEERINETRKDRGNRYQNVLGQYNNKNQNDDAIVSISKSTYSIQSNALAGDSYQSMKHKEVRDSISPTRGVFNRRNDDDYECRFTSDEEAAMREESNNVIKAMHSSDSKESTPKTTRKLSEIPVRKTPSPTRMTVSELSSRSSPTRRQQTSSRNSPVSLMGSPSKGSSARSSPARGSPVRGSPMRGSPSRGSPTRGSPTRKITSSGNRPQSPRKAAMEDIAAKMDASLQNEYNRLDTYLTGSVDPDDDLILEEEEIVEDSSGTPIKMIVQTRRKKDGTEYSSRRVARTTKVVDNESDIDEILVGNPDHEVLDRHVEEEVEKDGSKIKIITETRRRPDGIEYTTKNILKTSKIFDYDHPEDISYSEDDALVNTQESFETDEQGISIRTVTETRKKGDGTEYMTKKVYKTSKIATSITPSDDDEVLDVSESEETKKDGTVVKTVVEKRRTKNGQEYTHRQVYRNRRMTLSSIDLNKGSPMMDNEDQIIDRKEKEEKDENGAKMRIVTETRRRKDGTTYSFDYILRSFSGKESDVKKSQKMPTKCRNSANIAVSEEDKLINEEVKEELQDDGSTIKTTIERRRTKDGTEYLRHRIMRIPKLPVPVLQIGSLDDEVLDKDIHDDVLDDGTRCKEIFERRRSSVTGMQYTLRRMSKVYHKPAEPKSQDADETVDENVIEEETSDGASIRTVARRYQRPDGSIYTTQDVTKHFTNPISVKIDGSEDDDLIDRSYDEQETEDGYLIKTIVETRCRPDGVRYTIERTERVSRFGSDLQVSYKGNSISVGSPGDTVISREEHEEPGEEGTVVKTIVEIRQREDGTQYTNKTHLVSTQLLVPEHETSYIVIKPDAKDGEEDHGLVPSMEDEIVYTRKRQETDDEGNAMNIVIETRQNKSTGEKYNLTKRVHTTDVVLTDDGEKELPKVKPKPIRPKETPVKPSTENNDEEYVPYGSVSALKNRFATPGSAERPQSPSTYKTDVDKINTLNKKKFFEEAAAKSTLTSTSTARPLFEKPAHSDKSPKDDIKKSADPVKEPRSVKSSDESDYLSEQENKLVDAPKEKAKSPISKSTTKAKPVAPSLRSKKPDGPRTPSTVTSRSPSKDLKRPLRETNSIKRNEKDLGRMSDTDKRVGRTKKSTPSTSPEQRKSPTKGLSRDNSRNNVKRTESPPKATRSLPSNRVQTSPKTTTPVARTRPSASRDVTPIDKRHCCKRNSNVPEGQPDTIKRGSIPNDKQPSPSETTKPLRSKSPLKQSLSARRDSDSKLKIKSSPDRKGNKEATKPTVDIPETPMPQSAKPIETDVVIEDVSAEPNLPYHTIHRPSLVREPSDYNSQESSDEGQEPSEKKTTKKDIFLSSKGRPSSDNLKKSPLKSSSKPFERKPSGKSLLDKSSSDQSSDEKANKKSTYPRRGSTERPNLTDRRQSTELARNKSKFKDSPSVSRDESPKKDVKPAPKTKKLDMSQIEKSLESQIIPDKISDRKSVFNRQPSNEPKTKNSRKPSMEGKSTSSRRALFENRDSVSLAPILKAKSYKPKEKEVNAEPKPVVEPLIVPKYFHPLTDGETSPVKSPPTSMSKEEENENDAVSPLKEFSSRTSSPFFSRETSRQRSKEGSPQPFVKEDSPSRFPTGKPIDNGPNTEKIKKIERSLSNKKLYEDLEVPPSELPNYLNGIEKITEMAELDSLLKKAENYEERRIIRGYIRQLRSQTLKSTNKSQPTSRSFTEWRKPSTTPDTTRTDTFTRPSRPVEPKSSKVEERKPVSLKRLDIESSRKTVETKVMEKATERPEKQDPTSPEPVRTPATGRLRGSEQAPKEDEKSPRIKSYTRKDSQEFPKRKQSTDTSPETRKSPQRKISDDVRTSTTEPKKYTRKTSRDMRSSSPEPKKYTRKLSNDNRQSSPEPRKSPQRKVSNDTRASSPRKMSDDIRTSTVEPRRYQRKVSDDMRSTSPEPRKSPQRKVSNDLRTPAVEPKRSLRSSSPEPKSPQRKRSEDMRSSSPETRKSPQRKVSNDTKAAPLDRKSPQRKVSDDVKTPSKYARKVSEDEIPEFYRRTPRKTADAPDSTLKSRKSVDDLNKPKEAVKEKPTYGQYNKVETSYTSDVRRKTSTEKNITKSKPVAPSQPAADIFSQPLRHQRGNNASQPKTQSDVEKIVSPYGVGPTDENGVPLFGLKALRRKRQLENESVALPVAEPTPAPEPVKSPTFEPKDSEGRPMFGIRAIKKKSTEKSAFTPVKSTTAKDETTPVTSRTSPPRNFNRERSPSLVKSMDRSFRKRVSPSPTSDSEEEKRKSTKMKNILNLHESIAKSPEPTSPTRSKPKQKLKDAFQSSYESTDSKPYKTWDIDSDFSSTKKAVGSIISQHETITKHDTSAAKPEKKLTGILKKTSTSSISSRTDATDYNIRDIDEDTHSPDESSIPTERKKSYTEIKFSNTNPSNEVEISTSSSATVGCSDSTTRFQSSSSGRRSSGGRSSRSPKPEEMPEGRSFLDDRSKVTGFNDVLSRMGATEAVDTENTSSASSDAQARSLLNRFLGAQVLMSGVESMMGNASVQEESSCTSMSNRDGQTSVTREVSGQKTNAKLRDGKVSGETTTYGSGPQTLKITEKAKDSSDGGVVVRGVNIGKVTDVNSLNQLLDSCEEYDERRKVRMRLKTLMADKKALNTELSGHDENKTYSSSSSRSNATSLTARSGSISGSKGSGRSREGSTFGISQQSSRVSSSQKSNSYSTSSSSTFSTSQSSVMRTSSSKDSKTSSPFDKFKQMDSQVTTTKRSFSSSKGGSGPSGPLFQLSTSLNQKAVGIKDILLTWCQCRTRDYKGIKIENFSTSWNDGLAFCALIHHFYPNAFDYDSLDAKNRRHNFSLAFRVADEKAGVMALLDVDDMVLMKKPDWKCVFTYVQSLYKRLKDE